MLRLFSLCFVPVSPAQEGAMQIIQRLQYDIMIQSGLLREKQKELDHFSSTKRKLKSLK